MTVWATLLDLQRLDTVLSQLDHRGATLPERAAVADAEAALDALAAEVAPVDAARADLTKRLRTIELEVEDLEAKIAAEEEQMYAAGSDVSTLRALQDEIASRKARVGGLEDDELELMVEREPLDEQLTEFAARKVELDGAASTALRLLAEAEAALAAERDAIAQQRTEAAAAVDADLLVRYDRERSRLGGVAVAVLDAGGVCGACHMKLSAVEHDRILHLDPDADIECDDCGRHLVRS